MKALRVLAATTALALLAACSNNSRNDTAGSSPPPPTNPSSAPASTAPSSPVPSSSQQPGKPVETESNPPGDIPDNQAFVRYQAPGEPFSVKVPEGWGRTTASGMTSFTDKLNKIQIAIAASSSPATVQTGERVVVPRLQSTVPKFALTKVGEVTRAGQSVLLITYEGDSAPDAVTGKVVRDAFEAYLYYRGGRLLTLTLSGPKGADNVDPWRIVSDSVQGS